MVSWDENEDDRRRRLMREEDVQRAKDRRNYEIRLEKDKLRQAKKKAAEQAFQKRIDAEVESLINQNSPNKKKEFMDGLGGRSNLMQSVLGGGMNQNTINGAGRLRTERLEGSVMSLGKSSEKNPALDNEASTGQKMPKLSRPF